ncbi:unnamed protein product, partial [marine sediment metagenome]
MAAEGVFPKVDGDVLYGSEANKFNQPVWYKMDYSQGRGQTAIGKGIIKWSATSWQSQNADTADSGVTWTSGGYEVLGSDDIIAFAQSTKGVALVV